MADSLIPRFLKLGLALKEFVTAASTQGQQHIKPLHKYVSLRLVLEGGFRPEEVTPRPPLELEVRHGRHCLRFDPGVEDDHEHTVLGGLKSKIVDVVVCKEGVGPVVVVSVKGTGNAFRNLTNRMEEAIGDSTNVHIMYPGLVYGFLHLLKANHEGQKDLAANDVSVTAAGEAVPAVRRYHDVLLGLAGRRLIRDDYTRYEAVALAMVESTGKCKGKVLDTFPPPDSPLLLSRFFDTLYAVYDLRFPFVAASVAGLRRLEWDSGSPAFAAIGAPEAMANELGYALRIA